MLKLWRVVRIEIESPPISIVLRYDMGYKMGKKGNRQNCPVCQALRVGEGVKQYNLEFLYTPTDSYKFRDIINNCN